MELGCDPNRGFTLIPSEYQGWFFLLFVVFAFFAMCVGFYIIATTPIENESRDTVEPRKRKMYDKMFMELMLLLMLGLFASFAIERFV